MKIDVRNRYNKQAYWIRQLKHVEVPLEINHVLLSFMVLCFGLVLSKFVFFGELLFSLYGKRVIKKSVSITKLKERKTANKVVSDPSQSVANVTENPTSLSVSDFEIKTILSD